MATQEPKSLISEVLTLNQAYHENKEKVQEERKHLFEEKDAKVAEARKKACDELFEHIKGLIPEKVKQYAGYGRQEARIYEIKFRDGVKVNGCFAKDLLTKGDVISRLQEYLDKEHSKDGKRAFFIYFHHIGKYQIDHLENKYGVFVNWDPSAWEGIQKSLVARPFKQSSSSDEDAHPPQADYHPRMGYRNYTGRQSPSYRGGRGRGSYRGRGSVSSDRPPRPQKVEDLPTSHDA